MATNSMQQQRPSGEAKSHSLKNMKPEGSFTCSQDPATSPHPEPDVSCSHLLTLFS